MMRVIRIWYVFPRTLGYVHSLIPLLVNLRRKFKVIHQVFQLGVSLIAVAAVEKELSCLPCRIPSRPDKSAVVAAP